MCEPCFLYVNVSYSNPFLYFLIFAANAKSNHSNKRENVRRKKEAARVDESQYGSSSEDDRRAKTVKGEARGAEEIEKKAQV
tara:strand:- start:321 stop:566 length:246 start_codon:yes stop_codon:yes gene_type:complete